MIAVALLAQDSVLAPEILLLSRAKTHMVGSLKNQPNYTCLETIERSKREGRRKKFELIDVLRLEVALVGGKEHFAWPGSKKFEDTEIGDLVPAGGAIGSGIFASHAHAIFVGNVAGFHFEGFSEDGKTAKFHFTVPQGFSGYVVKNGRGDQATVAYHGSFRIDKELQRVTRIEVEADDIPVRVEIKSATNSMDYGDIRIGERDYWLPVSASLKIENLLTPSEFTNAIRFSGCRQFSGESTLSFGDAPADLHPEPVKQEIVKIPKDTTLTISLDRELDQAELATGDAIEARLAGAVKHRGIEYFPKGARVEGHIVLLRNIPGGSTAVIRFERIVDRNGDGNRSSVLNAVPDAQTPNVSPRIGSAASQRSLSGSAKTPGEATISTRGGPLHLPKGFRITWVTLEP